MTIVFGGLEYASAANVVRRDSCQFVLADRGCRKRQRPIRKITLHWTGGEPPSPERTYDVLQRRGLGVEFIGPFRDGTIYQCCDPLAIDARDDGLLDSVGIEIPNYGFIWPNRTRWGWRKPPKAGRDREVYCSLLRGQERYFADFYPAQKAAIMQWLDTTTAVLQIPRTVPLELNGCPASRTLQRAELAHFSGVLGHYHISKRKADPGPRLLHDVAKHFAARG